MGDQIEKIISGDNEALTSFIENAVQKFAFPELNHKDYRKKLWDFLYSTAKSAEDAQTLINCFSAIRILSREKTNLNELIGDEWLNLLKLHSKYIDGDNAGIIEDNSVAVEAQKCLCNVIFNSPVAAALSCKNGILEGIADRAKNYKNVPYPDDMKFFDMKLLFLLTTLCSEVRQKMKEELDLNEVLEGILKQAAENAVDDNSKIPPISLNDKQVDLVCEILKALFTLTLSLDNQDEVETERYSKLVATLRIYLLIPTNSKEKTATLQNNVINLLTNMPNQSYQHLVTPINPGQNLPNKLKFEDFNMTAFYEMLVFLQDKFTNEPTVSKQHEVLSPVVAVLLKGANSGRVIRKYLRNQILPPLRDVHNRPEQGTTLRNCLCRLLTTPITQLRDLVAELLFVLCKKSVNRMIKYTGYGNAAGLFAQRGLLGGRSDEGEADYSSDSGDSETEEYAEHKHGINPVIGCYEEPHPNVMENMTEEQKEYEAMKLVELMDNLTKSGTIKPCRVGADGKPEPIEHILQLREGLKSQQVHNNDSESD